MKSNAPGDSTDYTPDYTIQKPALYAWPPRPIAALHWLFFGMLYPWGLLFIAMAVITWFYLTPSMATMATLSPDWIALVWLRNALLLTLVAGTLHWWLHMRRRQDKQYKFHRHWLATDSKLFLWGDQVWDNMFWSIVSGVSFWTFFEVITMWFYASGRLPFMSITEHPVYFVVSLLGVFFWSTIHFYFLHRLLHWQPLYKISHELHHRNVNTGPWSGISMHPVEHVLYFTLFMLFWVVPVHPIAILLTGFFQGISPAISHSGFDQIVFKGKARLSVGDWFHDLHHQYFNFNYGNTPTPLDQVFGSWHDGSPESLQVQKTRIRNSRRKKANATL